VRQAPEQAASKGDSQCGDGVRTRPLGSNARHHGVGTLAESAGLVNPTWPARAEGEKVPFPDQEAVGAIHKVA
jgi:hypothetical protein